MDPVQKYLWKHTDKAIQAEYSTQCMLYDNESLDTKSFVWCYDFVYS